MSQTPTVGPHLGLENTVRAEILEGDGWGFVTHHSLHLGLRYIGTR